MKKIIKLHFITLAVLALLANACTKTDEILEAIQENKIPNVSTSAETIIKFAANNKSCGITDGFANQQHLVADLVHLNTDKCNGESFRPTLTLNFGEAVTIGTYTVGEAKPTGKQVRIVSNQYNYTNWTGTKGSVIVTKNATDVTKLDIQLKDITMANDNASTDTKNPASDTLTGFIIKI